MSFEIRSKVVALETGRGVPGLTVEAYDADLLYDDKLGVGQTDADGGCCIPVHVGFFSIARPDVYLVVKSKDGRVLSSPRVMLLPLTCLMTRARNSLRLCRLVVEVNVTWTIWPLVLPTADM